MCVYATYYEYDEEAEENAAFERERERQELLAAKRARKLVNELIADVQSSPAPELIPA